MASSTGLRKQYKYIKHLAEQEASNVYVIEDTERKKLLALKRVIGEEHMPEAYNEVDILQNIKPYCDDHFICFDHMVKNTSSSSSGERLSPLDIYMEYLPNYTEMFDYIIKTEYGVEEFPMIYEMARNCINAVQKLHDENVILKDFKPENVLIDPATGKEKIIDFGYSCRGEYCNLAARVGTPNYMAPELTNMDVGEGDKIETSKMRTQDYWTSRWENQNNNVTKRKQIILKELKRADIWSLGATLFTLLYQNSFITSPIFYAVLSSSTKRYWKNANLPTHFKFWHLWTEELANLSAKLEYIPVKKMMMQEKKIGPVWAVVYPKQFNALVMAIESMLIFEPENRQLIPLKPFPTYEKIPADYSKMKQTIGHIIL